MVISEKNYASPTPILVGKGYMKGDSLVKEAFAFTDKNFFHC